MGRTYLFARRIGVKGTTVLETTGTEAISIIKKNRKRGLQLGILCGPNYEAIRKNYGEYAPYRKVDSVNKLIENSCNM